MNTVYWSSDTALAEVRRVQRELQEQAARARLVAEIRRNRPSKAHQAEGPLGRAARMLLTALVRT